MVLMRRMGVLGDSCRRYNTIEDTIDFKKLYWPLEQKKITYYHRDVY